MIPLHLIFETRAPLLVHGWYLPSLNVNDWLTAVANQRAGKAMSYYLAPRSMHDRTASGLLALQLRTAQSASTSSRNREAVVCHLAAFPYGAWAAN